MNPTKREELEEKIRDVLYATGKFNAISQDAYDETAVVQDNLLALFNQYHKEEVERAEKAYFQSVLRSRAKTDPDMTLKEFYEGQFEQKHSYKGQQLTTTDSEAK